MTHLLTHLLTNLSIYTSHVLSLTLLLFLLRIVRANVVLVVFRESFLVFVAWLGSVHDVTKDDTRLHGFDASWDPRAIVLWAEVDKPERWW